MTVRCNSELSVHIYLGANTRNSNGLRGRGPSLIWVTDQTAEPSARPPLAICILLSFRLHTSSFIPLSLSRYNHHRCASRLRTSKRNNGRSRALSPPFNNMAHTPYVPHTTSRSRIYRMLIAASSLPLPCLHSLTPHAYYHNLCSLLSPLPLLCNDNA